MKKKWQIMPKIDDNFKKEYPLYSDLVLQLLFNRGIKDHEKIEEFLKADFDDTHDPFLFKDMGKAIDLVIKHIKKQNKIFIYGDYDADGVTSSALLFEVLNLFKAQVETYIPHRVTEGYGLNEKAVAYMAEKNCKLIITVDGGIRSKKEIKIALKKGVDVIVTDHHTPPDETKDYPNSLIINPLTQNENYPDKRLAGVGVAFKFAYALIQKSKLTKDDKKILLKSLLDFVAVGTVADCVRLRGENRIFVREGLKALSKTKRLGFKELFKVAKIKNQDNLDSWNIGFQIGPRLNAAGRMDHANTAYKLLISKEFKEAKSLAASLNERNIDRQKTTDEIFFEVEKQVKEEDKIMIGVFDSVDTSDDRESWNEGVIGLVAGKITQKYHRPALVITKVASGYKGSGRSTLEFNLIEAIENCSEILSKYGGHPQACGFSLKEEKLPLFVERIRKIADNKLQPEDLIPKINIEKEFELKDLNEETLKEIALFAPFGQANERPIFSSKGLQVMDIVYMGVEGKHLKLRLKQEYSNVFSALGFGQSEKWSQIKIGDKIDIAYSLELNEFNGRREVQMKIVDIKL